MKRYVKLLSASVSAALAGAVSAHDGEQYPSHDTTDLDASFGNIPIKQRLNEQVPSLLAAHRSHASHGSHGSHRSSSGSTATPIPTTPLPSAPPPRTQRQPQKQSDPLGQRPKPKGTYNPAIPDAKPLIADKALRKDVIMKVQLKLYIARIYEGGIDGVLGPETRAAIDLYKIRKGLKRGGYLDRDTLNALGVSIN